MGRPIEQEASLTAGDTFTDEIEVKSNSKISITIEGTFSGTLSVQARRRKADKTLTTRVDTGDTFTTSGLANADVAEGGLFRIGFKSGDFTSGTANVRIAYVPD